MENGDNLLLGMAMGGGWEWRKQCLKLVTGVTNFELLLRGLLQVGDQVSPILHLLKASKDHLGARNVLLGVL